MAPRPKAVALALAAVSLSCLACGGEIASMADRDAGPPASDDAGMESSTTRHESSDASTDSRRAIDSSPPDPGVSRGSCGSLPPGAAGVFPAGAAAVALNTPGQVQALAVSETSVYFMTGNGGASNDVYVCPLTGCPGEGPTLLAQNGGNNGTFLDNMAVGAGQVYWIDDAFGLSTCPFSGCSGAPAKYWTSPYTGYGAGSVTADGTNVYFPTYNAVYSCPLGSSCSPKAPFATPPGFGGLPGGAVAMAVSGSEVFYVDDAGSSYAIAPLTIQAVPVAGGASRQVCNDSNAGGAGDLAVSGGYAYTDSPGYKNIYACPITGKGKNAVFVKDPSPSSVVADATTLYWVSNGPTESSLGSVLKCPLGASCPMPTTIATNQNVPTSVLLTSRSIVWATSNGIYCAPK